MVFSGVGSMRLLWRSMLSLSLDVSLGSSVVAWFDVPGGGLPHLRLGQHSTSTNNRRSRVNQKKEQELPSFKIETKIPSVGCY